jgi:hypothetical protein
MHARSATVLASGATAAKSARGQAGFGFGVRHGVEKPEPSRVARTTAIGSAGSDRRIQVDEDAKPERPLPELSEPRERMNRS